MMMMIVGGGEQQGDDVIDILVIIVMLLLLLVLRMKLVPRLVHGSCRYRHVAGWQERHVRRLNRLRAGGQSVSGVATGFVNW
jgi:hypothetical protein